MLDCIAILCCTQFLIGRFAAIVVRVFRQRIAEIEEQLVKEPLRVLQLHQRRQNILSVVDKLELMLNVHHAQPTIQVYRSIANSLMSVFASNPYDLFCRFHIQFNINPLHLTLRLFENSDSLRCNYIYNNVRC